MRRRPLSSAQACKPAAARARATALRSVPHSHSAAAGVSAARAAAMRTQGLHHKRGCACTRRRPFTTHVLASSIKRPASQLHGGQVSPGLTRTKPPRSVSCHALHARDTASRGPRYRNTQLARVRTRWRGDKRCWCVKKHARRMQGCTAERGHALAGLLAGKQSHNRRTTAQRTAGV